MEDERTKRIREFVSSLTESQAERLIPIAEAIYSQCKRGEFESPDQHQGRSFELSGQGD